MPEIAFQYQIPKKMIGTFVVDAFLAEHYKFSNSVTDIPVEEGSNIADHIVEDQDVISVEAFIGNTAFEVITMDGNSVSNLEAPDRMARIRQAYQELKKLTKAKKPLDVVLGLETFTNMAITSFTIDRDVETGANLPFTMEFRKLKIVHSDTTKINASSTEAGSSGDQTAGTANAGTAGTEQPDNATAKAQWRFAIRQGRATPADYQREFGEPYTP
jgi:major membrane immunogen (membrane-anchored lipoprotein)